MIKIPNRKRFLKYAAFVFIFFGLWGLVEMKLVSLPCNLLFINQSGSLPTGIYMAVPMGKLEVGDFVRMEVPTNVAGIVHERGWLKPGALLLKKVGALEGTSYHIDDRFFEINVKYVGPVYNVDCNGFPMPKLRGNFIVKKGCFLPVANYAPNSFDGRYFGDVPLELIKGKVIPIWTQ